MERIKLIETLLLFAHEVEEKPEEGEDLIQKVFSAISHQAEAEARRQLVGFVKQLESEGCTQALLVLRQHGLLGVTADDVIEVEPESDFADTFRDNTLEIIRSGAPVVRVKWPR